MAGEDLLQYLILPPAQQPSPAHQSLNNSTSPQSIDNTGKRKASKMEFESPTVAVKQEPLDVLNDVFSINDFMATHEAVVKQVPLDALNDVFTIDDYMNTHEAAVKTEAAATAASSPVPVAVGARSSKHTTHLNDKSQSFGITPPAFVFTGDTVRGWSAKTEYLGTVLEVGGPFHSKQEAKEALSEKALEVVRRLEEEGTLRKPEKKKKKKSSAVAQTAEKEKKEPDPNYIGQLLEFHRANSAPQGTYVDYQLGTSFTCLLTVDGHSSPFGSQTALFPSKKAARQHAAKCAVEHFKAQGIWPEDVNPVGGIKKKKTVQPPPTPRIKSPSAVSPSQGSQSPLGTVPGSPEVSYPQAVASLAMTLSLHNPEWRFHPEEPAAPGFHTVSCYFKDGGPHEGPIGEVRHIFGKKKAKEECARRTLAYLLDVQERRLSYGRRMMEGGSNAQVIEDAARIQFEAEIGGMHVDDATKEEEDEFEDALEEIRKGDV